MATNNNIGLIIVLLLVMFIFRPKNNDQFAASDLNGTWLRNDGLMLNILGIGTIVDGGNAILSAVNHDEGKNTSAIIFKLKNLKHQSGNIWKGNSIEAKAGKQKEIVTFEMSDDRKSFKSQGYTYKKKSI